jgi:hypothetical protein
VDLFFIAYDSCDKKRADKKKIIGFAPLYFSFLHQHLDHHQHHG